VKSLISTDNTQSFIDFAAYRVPDCSTLFRAKSQSDHGAKRAEEILDLMERMVQAGDISVAPDVHSFSTVINGKCCIGVIVLV
jgi:hypothetical protein